VASSLPDDVRDQTDDEAQGTKNPPPKQLGEDDHHDKRATLESKIAKMDRSHDDMNIVQESQSQATVSDNTAGGDCNNYNAVLVVAGGCNDDIRDRNFTGNDDKHAEGSSLEADVFTGDTTDEATGQPDVKVTCKNLAKMQTAVDKIQEKHSTSEIGIQVDALPRQKVKMA
jgi:hypothetical protein